jgi:hypothetical protein
MAVKGVGCVETWICVIPDWSTAVTKSCSKRTRAIILVCYRVPKDFVDVPATNGNVKVTFSLCWNKHHDIKMYWGVEIQLHAFVTSVLGGGEWSASHSGDFIPLGKGLGELQSRYGPEGEEKNAPSFPMPGIESQSSNPYRMRCHMSL